LPLKNPTLYKQVIICRKCDYQFDEEPIVDYCPICFETDTIKLLIETMLTKDEYLYIKKRISKLNDSNIKFDLFNFVNRRKKDLNLKIGF
jgi:hypothetical protein